LTIARLSAILLLAPERESGSPHHGGMAEWIMATVLKTAVALAVTGGSNPSPSARFSKCFGEVPERSIGAAC
jgi:hypothetical protein